MLCAVSFASGHHLLGNVASLINRPLEFDPVPCKITNNDEADRALRPERREG